MTGRFPCWLAIFSLICAALPVQSVGQAQEPLRAQIDRLVALQTLDFEKLAAPVAGDEEFLRRVSLDLVGGLPTIAQTRSFLADADPQKREKLVDKFLASPEYARHMQQLFDVMLMRRLPQKNVTLVEWQKYLRDSFAQNKPWDQIVREILTADGADPANRGQARFYLDRDGDMHAVTKDVGKLFLGVNFDCVQCHNHPEVGDFLQAHYYGVSAFFVRSFTMPDKDKRVVYAEKADGEVTFESVFDIRDKISKGPQSSGLKLFASLPISEPKFDKLDDAYIVKPNDKDKTVRPVPRFSRRAKFAEFIASADNRRFCRSTANRLWAMFLGRGLVHPLEMDHSDNPPSHPLLLALLTEEVSSRQLNLKSLIREIVLSQTYQRSSKKEGLTDSAAQSLEKTFAVAKLRALSPEQFAWASLEATGETETHRVALGTQLDEQKLHDRLAGYQTRFVQLFGGEPGAPPATFESTTDQVLFLANDPMMVGLLQPKAGNLVDRLSKLPPDNLPAIADELYLSTLIRKPTAEDVGDVQAYLNGQTGEARTKAISELIWALISSAEFRFNH